MVWPIQLRQYSYVRSAMTIGLRRFGYDSSVSYDSPEFTSGRSNV
jgi:hypothetical protein